MGCHTIHSWTFCGLVGAFLDLALVYLLLWGSTLAFFASKFLGFFGLYLPCPCNGFFGNPNSKMCFQRLLVDCPSEKISSVQMSVKSKFPFDSIWIKNQGCHLNVKLVRDRDHSDGLVEIEGDSLPRNEGVGRGLINSSNVHEGPRNEGVGRGLINSSNVHEGRSDAKSKGIVNQKTRSGLRRRRRAAGGYGRFTSSDPSQLIVRGVSHSPYWVSEIGNEVIEESSETPNSSEDGVQYYGEAPTGIGLGERTLQGFKLNGSLGESKAREKDASSNEEFVCNAQGKLGFNGNEANVIRVLEQALEEERASCAALYLELEKERSAAASAADEAMAMILRLQKDKASVEMESRQYQRMIEEKSSYDAEEMNILEEILVRREREKYVLEKEVEAYRQMMLLGNEQMESEVHDMPDIWGQKPRHSLDSTEDPVLMLQRISECIRKKETAENANRYPDYEATSVEKQGHTFVFGKDRDEDADFLKQGDIHRSVSIDKHHPCVPGCGDECNQEFQEKGMVFTDENPSAPQGEGRRSEVDSKLYKSKPSTPKGYNLLEKTKEQEQKDNIRLFQETAMKKAQTNDETRFDFSYHGEDMEKHGKDAEQGESEPHSSIFYTKPSVYDVHAIDDKSKLRNEESRTMDAALDMPRKCSFPFKASGIRRIDVLSDCPSTSRAETDPNIYRSGSDIIIGLPPMGNPQRKTLPSDLQRNSMSAVDSERMKIEIEVGWLRERLRIVQKGREKLCFSVEHGEREKIQLQLLEDIANQLREIRKLTEPGKAVRQVSLPPPSSKVRCLIFRPTLFTSILNMENGVMCIYQLPLLICAINHLDDTKPQVCSDSRISDARGSE
ncbi:hypothetical protein HHK36_020313 [Tetracentron sinense]|uniref:GTD-binding domain-containing protein n=1 Tax=Tetracentron sinense TaxID=13715 RepID=A0A835D892_TETSI|nr:hypothetical protein HHK36_020313 [Tetracentron sinense]